MHGDHLSSSTKLAKILVQRMLMQLDKCSKAVHAFYPFQKVDP